MSEKTLLKNGVIDQWETRMVEYGQSNGNQVQQNADNPNNKPNELENSDLPSVYYDGAWVFSQIADYTDDKSWYGYAEAAGDIFEEYVIKNQGDISGHLVFTDGLVESWERSGDTTAKDALLMLAQNGVWTRNNFDYKNLLPLEYSRPTAYGIQTLINAEKVGYSNREQLNQLVDVSFQHLDQWFRSETAPYVKSFMVGLTANALVDYYQLSGDQRVVSELTHALDSLWESNWDAKNKWFKYADRAIPSENVGDSADLNLLIAPAYEWLYQQTGQERFRTRGETIFTGGVENSFLGSPKHFNQNYRWSFDYVELYQKDSVGEATEGDTVTGPSMTSPTPEPLPPASPSEQLTPETSPEPPATVLTPEPSADTPTSTPLETDLNLGAPISVPKLVESGTIDQWITNMIKYGNKNGKRVTRKANNFNDKRNELERVDLPAINYDGEWVFSQIASYTGDNSWYNYAEKAGNIYQEYVEKYQGEISDHLIFTDGLVDRWERTGSTDAKNSLLLIAENSFWTRSTEPDFEYSQSTDFSLSVASGIQTLINAEKVGYSDSTRLLTLVDLSFDHLDQWFRSETAPYVKSFMVGLTADALIDYYDSYSDQRVVSELAYAMDSLWDLNWDSENQWFKYADRAIPQEQAVDSAGLNLLIAPAYEWLYQQTGEERFRTRGEAIFASGVENSFLNRPKQFNQNYRWSFDYVELYQEDMLVQDGEANKLSGVEIPQEILSAAEPADFDAAAYLASHDDLIGEFGLNLERAAKHYEEQGSKEGREITFEADDYIASHADLIQNLGYDLAAATIHYIEYGAAEGRSRDQFDEISYLSNNSDLQAAFGKNYNLATRHYIEYGQAQGRPV